VKLLIKAFTGEVPISGNATQYNIGMDVHKESISIAVRNGAGRIVMECVIGTSMILQFIDGLRGDLHVTFEEGTPAAWLSDLLKPHVTKLVVCEGTGARLSDWGSHGPATEHMARWVRNISLDQVGCEARKIPAEGDVSFLNFYLLSYIELPRRYHPDHVFAVESSAAWITGEVIRAAGGLVVAT
jgi:hypothetical protein